MNCQTFENIIDDLSREQLIEAGSREEALLHANECAECALRLADGRMLTVGLRALAEDMKGAEAPARVQTELLTAFHQPNVLQRPARSRRWRYLSAAAAVLLVGFAIGIASWNWSSNVEQRAENPGLAPAIPGGASSFTPSTDDTGGGSKGKLEIAPNVVTHRRRGNVHKKNVGQTTNGVATDNSIANEEVATDFMPIGYVNSLSLQDGGSVVRVELPRSTIVSMGFAVNMNRYGERVKADVLMGADGLARAIRFVQ